LTRRQRQKRNKLVGRILRELEDGEVKVDVGSHRDLTAFNALTGRQYMSRGELRECSKRVHGSYNG